MAGNSIGEIFKVTTFGESHGDALGAVIDGMPAGLEVDLLELEAQLRRRAPGQHAVHTSRKEEDKPVILSGVFEGKTLGTPILVIVKNMAQRSQDYDALREDYRPGHADRTTQEKYGHRDHRGGGRASGRETVARVIGGYFAGLILPSVSFYAYVSQVGGFKLRHRPATHSIPRGELNFPDEAMTKSVVKFLKDCKSRGESAGGVVNLSILGCPASLGEPVFDKLKADLAKAMVSIPGCVGFALGAGFDIAELPGTAVSKDPAAFGGMEGGISNGDEIFLQLAFKAPSTVGEKARSGRHDPCIVPRVVPVVEAMAKVILADHWLRHSCYVAFRA